MAYVNFLWIILIVIIFGVIFWFFSSTNGAKYSKVIIGDNFWQLEIADSPALRTRGLSYRNSLAQDKAMLFIFEKPDFYGFWMFGMKFPIDIIFIDENLKITDIYREVNPSTYPENFKPSKKALYVLEVNSGQSSQLKVGDNVILK